MHFGTLVLIVLAFGAFLWLYINYPNPLTFAIAALILFTLAWKWEAKFKEGLK